MIVRCSVFVALVASLGLTVGDATAADLPANPSPSTMLSPLPARLWNGALWNGAYVGGNVGYGWARASSEFTLAGNAFVNGTVPGNAYDLNGINGGAQVGY